MAVYTELSKPFLKELADDYGLGRVTSATGIPEGSVNTNYVLEAAKGKFLLRSNYKDCRAERQVTCSV